MENDRLENNASAMSTGLPGLDRLLKGVMPGDNVVWQVDSIDDYIPFVQPYLAEILRQGKKLIYFSFARHGQLFPASDDVTMVRLDPEAGFEKFLIEILNVIEKAGKGAYYVFDCLSDLAGDWYSDRMLGNFFMIACPFLYEFETVAYFALLKNHHSFHATDGINNTAQVILDIYREKGQLYLHPLKAAGRFSPTMYMLHKWEGEEFRPVTGSAVISQVLAGTPKPWLEFTIQRRGVWAQTYLQAQETLDAIKSGKKLPREEEYYFNRLLKMAVTRDERFSKLAKQYFDLSDLMEILKRMIGTGLIGGKTLGMLLARAILKKNRAACAQRLEAHDSFFIGSDVFYTFLVQNGCWWLRLKHKDFDVLLHQAAEAAEKLLTGVFPEYIQNQFAEMLDYFGQSPIIVRSSSLLEDNYGNAFSGKYESVYCANQGTPQERLDAFINAMRTVYASTMSQEALSYRLHHGLLDRDEQMAILVQRVSGEMYGPLYFPQIAGVGFSFNPYVWNEQIDPQAGMLRLVFGLGTRAVERTDDDYTRVVALNVPQKRPEANVDELRQYAQKNVDVLDLTENKLLSRKFEEVAKSLPENVLETVASIDQELLELSKDKKRKEIFPWLLTFDRLFSETLFIQDMREMLTVLSTAYSYPVDVEFTTNFLQDDQYRINLVQCRPFQVKIKREGVKLNLPEIIPPENLILETRGPIIGQSLATIVDRIIYVVPSVYGKMTISERYSVARIVGRLTRLETNDNPKTIILVGPGRWGTSMPSLGVPVSFAEINKVSVLCEIACMHENLVPDVSLGTHFFNDLVEMDILYLAVFPEREGNMVNDQFFRQMHNRLTDLLADTSAWTEVIRVIDAVDIPREKRIYLNVDSMKQRAACYQENPK
ncbi:MAG: PEP/pyruvate-binding domain-containing protein [Phycisphaerae bacterium]